MATRRRPSAGQNPAAEARDTGSKTLAQHPLFAPLHRAAQITARPENNPCPPNGWAVVSRTGQIHLNPRRRGTPQEWTWVIAHCLLHLGFDHLESTNSPGYEREWNAAACLAVNAFLRQIKVGRPPEGLGAQTPWDHLVGTAGDEARCAQTFREKGLPEQLQAPGVGGTRSDLLWTPPAPVSHWATGATVTWPQRLAAGLTRSVVAAVDVAGGATASLAGGPARKTPWRLALDWFIASYPLLGGLAAAFTLVEDADIARRNGIQVAAISPAAAEIYVNPLAPMDGTERRFVIAHELLHAGLRHDSRATGRDPWLWNVACDYVINGWLIQMQIADPPDGLLHDRTLDGMSAEEVYDRIVTDTRRLRKAATLRGIGAVDVLSGRLSRPDERAGTVDLDEFYRRSLQDGIQYHTSQDRGLLPAGLIEEIRALGQPPVPWDVDLARWFDAHFAPIEPRRSYARASRRQSATPDIPRPGRYIPQEQLDHRTFGVVLDTSGSMDTRLLGKALGAIASYAVSRTVPAVRVVFCDADAYDNGWMEPTEIASRVRVRGRGGTILQPGIDLLEKAPDFPADGPILVITDTGCDHVRLHRDHAFLIPAGTRLPFSPRGPVFKLA